MRHLCFVCKNKTLCQICSKCRLIGYCSIECQRDDFETHKIICEHLKRVKQYILDDKDAENELPPLQLPPPSILRRSTNAIDIDDTDLFPIIDENGFIMEMDNTDIEEIPNIITRIPFTNFP